MKIKRNDIVKVITGKDSGKEGKVLRVFPKDAKIVVEGVNIAKKHLKAKGKEEKGGIIDIEKSFDISNVMLVCPKCKKATRVGFKFIDDKKHRICKKCQGIIE